MRDIVMSEQNDQQQPAGIKRTIAALVWHRVEIWIPVQAITQYSAFGKANALIVVIEKYQERRTRRAKQIEQIM